jgi:hypothetical protein
MARALSALTKFGMTTTMRTAAKRQAIIHTTPSASDEFLLRRILYY